MNKLLLTLFLINILNLKIGTKKNMKKILTIISITSVLLFVLPFFIEAFINLKSDYWTIVRDHKDAWISYYGAIIGGGLTLLGVWWTITDMKKQEQKNKTPMIDLEFDYRIVNSEKPKFNCVILTKFKNVGSAVAYNVSMTTPPIFHDNEKGKGWGTLPPIIYPESFGCSENCIYYEGFKELHPHTEITWIDKLNRTKYTAKFTIYFIFDYANQICLVQTEQKEIETKLLSNDELEMELNKSI